MPANYLKESIVRAGLDPDHLPKVEKPGVGTGGHDRFKLWKDIWAAGQGVGNIDQVTTVAELVARLEDEYRGLGLHAFADRLPLVLPVDDCVSGTVRIFTSALKL